MTVIKIPLPTTQMNLRRQNNPCRHQNCRHTMHCRSLVVALCRRDFSPMMPSYGSFLEFGLLGIGFVIRLVEGRGGGLALLWRSSLQCGSRRCDSWNFIRRLSQDSPLPWCIIGDFNDILSSIEKKGRVERANWLINGFRQAVLDFGLSDVHMEGYPFTWFKSLGTSHEVEERLRCALANEAMVPSCKIGNFGGSCIKPLSHTP
ncbi:endonuclease/exonuclease/phosphatase family protein [Trifolium medium]|uniref:Endonuclease/exonuclease/phosphatase family protein n=1 Tax=Trifolium medium TaxID=97028 RepID=A0A392M5Q4_9FABA|nr:endonuclease/exonuclease/phosphatase family protein [Trifolium medium]